MLKLLYISEFIPYDKIRHAGGQTFNYYVNNILKQNDIETIMIGFCKQKEKQYFDKSEKGLKCYTIVSRGTIVTDIKRITIDLYGRYVKRNNPYLSYYKEYYIIKILRKLKNSGYYPDVIDLEWTAMVMEAEIIRSFFPKAKIIASEHDVTFLRYKRKIQQEKGRKKDIAKKQYEYMKKAEISALKYCDIIMTQCEKDKQLLLDCDINENKIYVLSPYYHDMRHIDRIELNHDILFWGAMYRADNYEAAIWFIDNVMPLLKDVDVRFVIAGNRPPQKLKAKANERVIVTGFVENEVPLFEQSLCFVSPLLTGAGIKVKVIEALSAGIPVLTNTIGIEGISAVNGESYFHCEKPEDYARVIKYLLKSRKKVKEMCIVERLLINTYFNLEQSSKKYIEMIEK